jgi:hypothetical protein
VAGGPFPWAIGPTSRFAAGFASRVPSCAGSTAQRLIKHRLIKQRLIKRRLIKRRREGANGCSAAQRRAGEVGDFQVFSRFDDQGACGGIGRADVRIAGGLVVVALVEGHPEEAEPGHGG